jgi:hypothetical protein
MKPDANHFVADAAVRNLIQRKARRLAPWLAVGQAACRQDIEQTLWTHLFSRLRAYDPGRGSRAAFAEIVLLSFATNLLRDQGTKKRRGRPRRLTCGISSGSRPAPATKRSSRRS